MEGLYNNTPIHVGEYNSLHSRSYMRERVM